MTAAFFDFCLPEIHEQVVDLHNREDFHRGKWLRAGVLTLPDLSSKRLTAATTWPASNLARQFPVHAGEFQ
jgi:hypothetical protein